ncbi:MAG: alpha-glucan family phosphorylase [Candidatus Sulfotelmatobacter sp.]
MKPIRTFKVRPCLPEPLLPLLEIARNLRWSWDHGAIQLFLRLDRDLWESCGHNPVLFLGTVDQRILHKAAADGSFLAHMAGVAEALKRYLSGEGSWYRREHGKKELQVAYFSAEFGITECLSIFAGGLGVLAGDHLKAASDLGVPLVGVGLLYQQGYFRQHLNASGWQKEVYEENDFHNLPISPLPEAKIQVDFPDRQVAAQVWSANVGRLKLFLLDTNIAENSPEDRQITHQLYGGNIEMRLKQEIVLGIGGYRALEAMGLKPSVYHMNEGHSAFLGLERLVRIMETEHISFKEARELGSASLIFTTHTPVPAGHDYFSPELMNRYFGRYLQRLGISLEELMALGRVDPMNHVEDFCMTVLALRLACFSNGVSKLHGEVSRSMWNDLWKDLPECEVPIGHVTNGVHFRSWISFEMNQLYDRYLGPDWREEPADAKLWARAESIPATELWRTHERRREQLVSYARRRLHDQLVHRGAPRAVVEEADEVLSPDALTIGFARRFASYKRANLLIRNPERLAKILNHAARPVQIVYAGKAHPQDDTGKRIIQEIAELAKRPEFRRKIVFLENYDPVVARYMVQGCDVWLNTPLRPQEASGTSGMKAQVNGVLNLSTLDGWWDEAWQIGIERGVEIGWAIGRGEVYSDVSQQDDIEAEALYDTLESEIVPAFYERRADGLPRKWIAYMKSSIAALCPQFNMHRMVKQYTNEYYVTAHKRFGELSADHGRKATQLAAWLSRVAQAWPQMRIESVSGGTAEIELGTGFEVAATVLLGSLTPDDVAVEVVMGRLSADGRLAEFVTSLMQAEGQGQGAGGRYVFKSTVQPTAHSGRYGLAVRVLPRHVDAQSRFLPGLILWAENQSDDGAVSSLAAGSGL